MHERCCLLGGGGRRCAASAEGLLYESEDDAAVLGNAFGPREAAHLREVDAPKTKSRDQDIYAVTEGLVGDRGYGIGDGFGAIGFGPAMLHLGVRFGDGHF